jgi:hypothetical protein
MQKHRITGSTFMLALLLALPAAAVAAPQEGRQARIVEAPGWSALWSEAQALLAQLLPAAPRTVPRGVLPKAVPSVTSCDYGSAMDPNGGCGGGS